MQSFWSRESPYEPVAQDDLKIELESQSGYAAAQKERPPRLWLQRALLLLAIVNVLLGLAALIATRSASRAALPISGRVVSALPRPDPYIGLHMMQKGD